MFQHTLSSLRALGAVVTLAAAALTAQPAAAQDEFTQALDQANQSLQAEEYDQAVEAFTQAVQLNPVSAEALVGRAKAYMAMEEYEAAQQDVVQAMTYGAGAPEVMAPANNLRGEIYIKQGAYDLALTDFQAAVDMDRGNPDYQFNLGKAYALLGGAQQGVDALTKYLESESPDVEKNAEAHQLRAQAYATMGKTEEALADIETSLELDPENHESHFVKATVLLRDERFAEAAEAFKGAIDKYEPEEGDDLPFIQAHLVRASALEEAGKRAEDPEKRRALYAEEKAECERLLEALPDRQDAMGAKAQALFRLGVAQRLLLDYHDAVQSFSEALDINPALAEAYFRRGICFFHLGEEQMAIRDFEQASAIDFQSPRAALWMGRTHAQLGEYYEALKAYGEALAVSDRYTDAYVNRGLVYVQLGEYEKAIEDFNQAIRLKPTTASHYLYRGAAYRLMGDHQKAIKSLARAIELDDQHAESYLQMARALEAFGRPDVAGDYRQRGEQLAQAAN